MARLRSTAARSIAPLFLLSLPSLGSAAFVLGAWLDGNTTPDGEGKGTSFSLTAASGVSSFTLLTTAHGPHDEQLGLPPGHRPPGGLIDRSSENKLFLGCGMGSDSGNVVDRYGTAA